MLASMYSSGGARRSTHSLVLNSLLWHDMMFSIMLGSHHDSSTGYSLLWHDMMFSIMLGSHHDSSTGYSLLLLYFPGKPEPTIKWFKEGKEVSSSADFQISFKDKRVALTIPEVFEEDGGKYVCSATNDGGKADSSAELIIKGKISCDHLA